MRKLPAFCVIVAATAAYASNCPSGDAMLKNNTPLNQLCPNGFTSKSGGSIENAMANQKDNVAMVYASAQNTGVPTDLALAVSYHESVGFNSCAGSDTGVKGPMQLTQRTARSLGFDRDINQQNINGGMAVLKRAYDKCGYNYTCLSANYNGSPRPVNRQVGRVALRQQLISSRIIQSCLLLLATSRRLQTATQTTREIRTCRDPERR